MGRGLVEKSLSPIRIAAGGEGEGSGGLGGRMLVIQIDKQPPVHLQSQPTSGALQSHVSLLINNTVMTHTSTSIQPKATHLSHVFVCT